MVPEERADAGVRPYTIICEIQQLTVPNTSLGPDIGRDVE